MVELKTYCMITDEESSASPFFFVFLHMETFESGCWKRGMLAFHLMGLCHLKLKDLFKDTIFIILASGQIFTPRQFFGFRLINDANSLTFMYVRAW